MDKSINPYAVIKRPLVTEKSTSLSAAGKYIFEVDMRANKPQIKTAVEKAFSVTVTDVNVLIMKAKPRGRTRSRRAQSYGSDWKKAVVTLAAGSKIELFEGV
jgi:large subunit ribosomal protein L23